MAAFTQGWLAGKQIDQRATSVLCKTNISPPDVSHVRAATADKWKAPFAGVLSPSRQKRKLYDPDGSRRKWKTRVGLCRSQPSFPRRKRKESDLWWSTRLPRPVSDRWEVAEGEMGGGGKTLILNVWGGFFFRISFWWFEFPQNWDGRPGHPRAADRDLWQQNRNAFSSSSRLIYRLVCSSVGGGGAGQKKNATIRLLQSNSKMTSE